MPILINNNIIKDVYVYIFIASIKNAFLQLWNAKPDTSDHGQKLQEFYLSFMPLSTNQENELKKIERLSVISKVHINIYIRISKIHEILICS